MVKVLEYPPRQQLYIELKDKLRKKTNFTLNLRWYSLLIPEPEGFYVDQYEEVSGNKRCVILTNQPKQDFNNVFDRHCAVIVLKVKVN